MSGNDASAPMLVCRLATQEEWAVAREAGFLPTRGMDVDDGFMHLSTIEQALETANRHFRHEEVLLALCAPAASLGSALRWEPSRGGALFPHYYGSLKAEIICEVRPLRRGAEGDFSFAHETSE